MPLTSDPYHDFLKPPVCSGRIIQELYFPAQPSVAYKSSVVWRMPPSAHSESCKLSVTPDQDIPPRHGDDHRELTTLRDSLCGGFSDTVCDNRD